VSWTNPETLHQLELNAEIRNQGSGQVDRALCRLFFDARLISDNRDYGFDARPLKTSMRGKSVDIVMFDVPWQGARLTLFRSLGQRLFKIDWAIFFKKAWIESDNPPFIYCETYAPDMETQRGLVSLRRRGSDLVLVRGPPEIGEITQDGRNRAFLTRPDMVFGP